MSKRFVISAVAAAVIATGVALSFKAAMAADTVRTGAFTGASHHEALGHVEIVKDGEVTKVIFKDDFTLQEAPAPRLAWGKDGYKRGTIFAKLAKFKGAQEYVVPAGADVTQYNEFWIWCEKADVALAVAKLK